MNLLNLAIVVNLVSSLCTPTRSLLSSSKTTCRLDEDNNIRCGDVLYNYGSEAYWNFILLNNGMTNSYNAFNNGLIDNKLRELLGSYFSMKNDSDRWTGALSCSFKDIDILDKDGNLTNRCNDYKVKKQNIEVYASSLLKNGGNRNYYDGNGDNPIYNTTTNYPVFDKNSNTFKYTYNDINYNYNINNFNYNIINNNYTFNTTNNYHFTYINNFNSTTIINPNGQTQSLYYMLPDGSNSFNLTEEQAKKGYKTSLNVASYDSSYDDDDLLFLYHFDGNQYNSSYSDNTRLLIEPNSVEYINSSNPNFNQALVLTSPLDSNSFNYINLFNDNLKDSFITFRIYPQVGDLLSLWLNQVNILNVKSVINTKYDYVEWQQTTNTSSSSTNSNIITVTTTRTVDSGLHPACSSIVPQLDLVGKVSSALLSSKDGKDTYSLTCAYKSNLTSNMSGSSSTNQRTYNIINNKLYEDSLNSLININQWNYISYNSSNGDLYINGVKSNINVPYKRTLQLAFRGDSHIFIDELSGFKTARSNTPPSIPFDSNITYFLPAVEWKAISPVPIMLLSSRQGLGRFNGGSITPESSPITFNTYQKDGSPPTWSYTFTKPIYITRLGADITNNRGNVTYKIYINDSLVKELTTDKSFDFTLDTPIESNSLKIYQSTANYRNDVMGYNVYSLEPFKIYYSDSIKSYNVTLSASPSNGGTVEGAGTYKEGEKVTIKAIPTVGYNFIKWSDGNTESTREITVTSDIVLSAEFEKEPTIITYNVNLTSSPSNGGTVEGAGTYKDGETVTLKATPKTGFKFLKWSDGNTESTREITVNSDIDLTAYFYKPNEIVKVNTEVKNNMLLIQSKIPITSWKFGGIRPSSPKSGNVYISCDETGNITSIQQFNGIEWLEFKGSVYNDDLKLWVNAIGFNIFFNNWSYQEVDFRGENYDTNVLIRFFTTKFNNISDKFDVLIEEFKNISFESNTINNIVNDITNNFNFDIKLTIESLFNDLKVNLGDIDLNSPSFLIPKENLDDLKALDIIPSFASSLNNSGFGWLITIPLVAILVGTIL